MKKILTIIIVVVALQLGVVSIASAGGGDVGGGSYHRVRYGDTLYSIGRQYGVSARYIADVNGLRNLNRIYAGQVLYIPSDGYGRDYDRGRWDRDCYDDCGWGDYGGGRRHRVRYGETLYSIGRRYDVHPNHIAQVNNLYNPNYIYAGQWLRIPSGSSYPWPGSGCGGYGYGDGYGCGRYGSGDRYGSGCDGYDSGCDWYNSGCDGYNSGCTNYGYDYTGYYYSNGNQRYSFTCGYNFNCW